MTKFSATQDRDGNREIISSNEAFKLSSEWTFVNPGTGATGSHTLFTVTGDILVNVWGYCSVNMAGSGADFEVGVTGNTAGLIAQIADVEDLDAGEVYQSNTPTVGVGVALANAIPLHGGLDILLKITNANITAGVVDFYCTWRPLSENGLVEVTTPA